MNSDKILLEKIMKNNNKDYIIKEVIKFLDFKLSRDDIKIEDTVNFIMKLKKILNEKKMEEEFSLIENIYFLNKNYITEFINSTNVHFLFMLEKFYSKSHFLDFYLMVLEKIKGVITKNNLLFLLSEEFNDMHFQIKSYIQYLKDGNEYINLEEEELLEYEIFREIFSPYVQKNIENMEEYKVNKILSFFEKMAQSPDTYIEVLLRDTVIEGGWLEEHSMARDHIKKYGDNFLILYALVYDGRIFLKNEDIWKEVENRKLKI